MEIPIWISIRYERHTVAQLDKSPAKVLIMAPYFSFKSVNHYL